MTKDNMMEPSDSVMEVFALPADKVVPGMMYVPFQQWGTPYEPEVGFERGTLFPVLDKPFIGEEAVKRGR